MSMMSSLTMFMPQIPELDKESVRIKDKERVLTVIKNVISNGMHRLQVVSDFDSTLSRFVDDNGQPCDTCYSVLAVSERLPLKYRQKVIDLERHYTPIELDSTLSIEEKAPLMRQWWTEAGKLLLETKLKQKDIEIIVSESKVKFRTGCDWLFQNLHKYCVPLLIFSAGIGDVIVEAIKQRAFYYDNMEIVSNFMDFDEQGVLKGFKGELIHVFNKNESAVHESSYFEDLSHRDNIFLLGDSLGDLRMADGAAKCENLLRIGFLNEKIEERLPLYLDAFDIVLINDQTMDIPNAIVRQMVCQ